MEAVSVTGLHGPLLPRAPSIPSTSSTSTLTSSSPSLKSLVIARSWEARLALYDRLFEHASSITIAEGFSAASTRDVLVIPATNAFGLAQGVPSDLTQIAGPQALVAVRDHILRTYNGEQPLFSSFLVRVTVPPTDAPATSTSTATSTPAPVAPSTSSTSHTTTSTTQVHSRSTVVTHTLSNNRSSPKINRSKGSRRPRFICWTCIARVPSALAPDFAYNGVWSALCCINDYNRRITLTAHAQDAAKVRPIQQIAWPDFAIVLGSDHRNIPYGWDARIVDTEAARQMAVALRVWLERPSHSNLIPHTLTSTPPTNANTNPNPNTNSPPAPLPPSSTLSTHPPVTSVSQSSVGSVDDLAQAEQRHWQAFPSRDATDSKTRMMLRLEQVLLSGELVKRGLCSQEELEQLIEWIKVDPPSAHVHAASRSLAQLFSRPDTDYALARQRISERVMSDQTLLRKLFDLVYKGDVAIHHDIARSEIELVRSIGSGGSGVVHVGKYNGQPVAIKLFFESQGDNREFKKELALLSLVRGPKVVELFGGNVDPSFQFIVMELMAGSLFDLLRNQTYPMNSKQRFYFAFEIADAMAALHKAGIIHRDLKSLNVLYNDDLEVKLCDFGMSKITNRPSTTTSGSIGTAPWVAPEIFRREEYTFKSDVYSFGIVMWELLTRLIPYHNIESFQEWRALMKLCWHKKIEKRPVFEEIVKRLISIRSSVVVQGDQVGRSPAEARKMRPFFEKGADRPVAEFSDMSDSSPSDAVHREALKFSDSDGAKEDLDLTQRVNTPPSMPATLEYLASLDEMKRLQTPPNPFALPIPTTATSSLANVVPTPSATPATATASSSAASSSSSSASTHHYQQQGSEAGGTEAGQAHSAPGHSLTLERVLTASSGSLTAARPSSNSAAERLEVHRERDKDSRDRDRDTRDTKDKDKDKDKQVLVASQSRAVRSVSEAIAPHAHLSSTSPALASSTNSTSTSTSTSTSASASASATVKALSPPARFSPLVSQSRLQKRGADSGETHSESDSAEGRPLLDTTSAKSEEESGSRDDDTGDVHVERARASASAGDVMVDRDEGARRRRSPSPPGTSSKRNNNKGRKAFSSERR